MRTASSSNRRGLPPAAAAFGLPVVTTRLLANQLGWPDAEAIGAADMTDPSGFAARVVALHRDGNLWTRIREAALARVDTELDPAAFASQVVSLLSPHETGPRETARILSRS